MSERWEGFGLAAVFALLGAGAAVWLIGWRPGPEMGARVLLIAICGGFGAWCFCGKSKPGEVRGFGIGLGILFAMSGGVWVYNIDSWVFEGLVQLRGAAWARFGESWETLCIYLLPTVGVLVAVGILTETAKTTVRRIKGEQGRKAAESELYGKSRFLKRRYMKKLARSRGLLLGRDRDGVIAYPLEGSAISFAPPRVGKGATIALNLLSPDERGWPGSVVVVDPRGELFPVVARRRRSLGRRPILLDPFGVVAAHRSLEGGSADFGEGAVLHLPVWQSDTYNPLDFIREGDEAVRDIGVLVDALMERPTGGAGNSMHFYESARSLISGYISWVRFKVPPAERNLQTLYRMLSMGNEERDKFFAEVKATDRFCGGLMHMAMERSQRVGKEEGGSNFTTVSNQLSFLNYPEIVAQTKTSSFDPLDLANGDMDLFVVVPDDMIDLVKGWLRLWISIPYAAASRRAMQRDMLIVVDEMPRIGYLKPLMDAYNLAAGKGVHIWSFAQTFSALEETWGKEAAGTLIDLAELVQILGFPRMDVSGADRLSTAIGAATFENPSESRSGKGPGDNPLKTEGGTLQESMSVVKERLVTADDLMTMGPDEQFVIASPKDIPRDALKLRHARFWEMPEVAELADPNPYVVRKERAAAAVAA